MSSSNDEPLRRVLIASANPLFGRGLQKMVAQRWAGRNVEIRLAGSMEEASASLEEWQPDLVIVDYDDVGRPGSIQRSTFLSHFISEERPMQVMLVSLRESGEVVVYDRRMLTPDQAEDWLDLPWMPAPAADAARQQPAPQIPAAPAPSPEPAAASVPAFVPALAGPQSVSQFIPRSGGMKHYISVGVITVILTLLVGFGLQAADLTPRPSSAQAVPIDSMIHLQTWMIAFLFSLIVAFIGYSIFGFRHKNPNEYGAPFKSSTGLEVAWTLVPLITVIVLSFIGAQDLAAVRRVDPQALEVKVTAFQWGWAFEYPDSGVKSNQLYLPVNKQVHLSLTSRDVIHSFWVPEFRVKQDVLPGANLVKELRINPTQIGDYKVRCAEMCGGAHALMESPVKVVSQADFDAWIAQQGNTANLSPADRGKNVAQTTGCLSCHTTNGAPLVGPTWKGLYQHEVPLADGTRVVADDAYIHTSIVDPNAQVVQGFPQGVMQSYKGQLSDEQINDIIEFIKTLK